MKHKHCELIKAWADGAEIQYRFDSTCEWVSPKGNCTPAWDIEGEFRIKPEPKPDVEVQYFVTPQHEVHKEAYTTNLKLTFDGKTGKLKDAEVLK